MNAPAGAATPRVAIIGSGFSGIAAAIALRKKGIEDFTIFEQAPELGGTWFYNRYPGAEVDLESHIYSFSFERYDWTRTHAGWQELLGYLNHVARKWDLPRRILFNEKVEDVTWSDSDHTYTLTTSTGADHGRFTAVISAVGFLNTPLLPPFAREEHDFEGVVCHTSRWPEGADMTGKSVGVVGTGSSAVQIVTEAERVGKDVKIFQIEPNWLLPKESRDFTPAERRLNQFSPVYAYRRLRLYLNYDVRQYRSSHARSTGMTNKRKRRASEAFLQQELGSRPDLLKLATPSFPYEGRRTVVSDTYYRSLLSPKVTLVPQAVKGLTRTGAIDANGDEHDLDMIVLATGFDAANYLGNYRVHGRGGVDLHSEWKGEPEAFLGMMVPGFPNFFIMYGPNTNAIPLVSFYEAQAGFVASLIGRAAKQRRSTIEVRRSAFVIYNDWIQARLAKTVWSRTRNYFQAGTGRVVSQWPFGATSYILATKVLRRIAVRLS
ncbi:flavin-containing monooxygenase [Mycolicibacterium confluentis]|uniref:4-hydroxyacetophenone monooxygenase n=1 Tax=Mycolicibacterium confluentis TaxID=28047 RepID=A0A7I7XRW3_9MYCO|nr:NAD(P)/FAD-dependent oxidoreductase [Mycolicibacterium confluentis]MCV7318847.1 NAD(P)/FAD-dependent oxidoreductase [Mycolicibacterium confluentis]ORV23042.1 4-hydroxyacetophenone monooxygenase [Mycolicibacterium confluentis]BBZ31999.1 4-hydroxyacetophenone monooxygenase [Mycolicibacterium confluentis]